MNFVCEAAQPEPGSDRAARFGVQGQMNSHITGILEGPGGETAWSIGLELSTPMGRIMRYHLEVGLLDIAFAFGVRFSPVVLGFEIPLYESGDFGASLEIIAALIQSELMFPGRGPDFMVFLSSGVRVAGTVWYGPMYFTVTPIGLDIRYFRADTDTGAVAEPDAHWPFNFSLGFQF